MPTPTTRLTRRECFSHWAREQVRFSDTDALGHVNNLAFGAFAETGRCMFLKRFVEKGSAQPAMFLPATIAITFLGEVHWPAAVEVGTGILSIGNSSFRFGQGMFEEGRCFATSEAVFVHVGVADHRPQPIPDSIREWLGGYVIEGEEP